MVSCKFLYIALVDCRNLSSKQKCFLCGEIEGAAVRCSDCNKEFHASCAWKQGHKFGFEIQPVSFVLYFGDIQINIFIYQVKSSRRDTTTTTTFKGESGCMNAIVSCKDHDHSKRDIYDICETNESGEVRLCGDNELFPSSPLYRLPFKSIVGPTNKFPLVMDMGSFVKLVVWTIYSMFEMKLQYLQRLQLNHSAIDATVNSLQPFTPWQSHCRCLMDSRRT